MAGMRRLVPCTQALRKFHTPGLFGVTIHPAQTLALEHAEPWFHVMHPRTMDGCEVHHKARRRGEPSGDVFAMMRPDMVTHQRHRVDGLGQLLIQVCQEGDACLLACAGITRAIDPARTGLEGGQEVFSSSDRTSSASRGRLGESPSGWRHGFSCGAAKIRRMVAAELSATSPSARRGRPSSAPSHGERLRPSRAGRSQARRTTWMATSGGNIALGPAARSVREAIHPLGQQSSGPFAHDRALDANGLGHVGVCVPSRHEAHELAPADPPGGDGG
jgi:hypothetical protein